MNHQDWHVEMKTMIIHVYDIIYVYDMHNIYFLHIYFFLKSQILICRVKHSLAASLIFKCYFQFDYGVVVVQHNPWV